MGDHLKKVKTGDPLVIPAQAFNSFVDAANDLKARQMDGGNGVHRSMPVQYVLVKNGSGADLDRFGVLGIDAPVILPTDNLDEFKNRVVLSGVTPAAKHAGRFVVLHEPLANGSIGRACISGACLVKVNVIREGHTFADVEPAQAGRLKSVASGSASILWSESGTGEKWAVVKLGTPGPIYVVKFVHQWATLFPVLSVMRTPTLYYQASASTIGGTVVGVRATRSSGDPNVAIFLKRGQLMYYPVTGTIYPYSGSPPYTFVNGRTQEPVINWIADTGRTITVSGASDETVETDWSWPLEFGDRLGATLLADRATSTTNITLEIDVRISS